MDESECVVDCSFCGSELVGIETAIDAGWVPSFYVDWSASEESGTAVCPACAATHLDYDPDGEYSVKPGHACFIRPESLGIPADVIATTPAPNRG